MRVVKVLFVVATMVSVIAPATNAVAQDMVKVKDGCGTIVKVVGNTVIARIDETGKTRVFKNVGPDIKFMIEGKDATVYDLREGMHACAYHLETAEPPVTVYIEEHEIATVVDEPDLHDTPQPAAKPVPAAKPAPAPAPMLPKTGSQLPLAGLAGLLLLALSTGIAVLRRF